MLCLRDVLCAVAVGLLNWKGAPCAGLFAPCRSGSKAGYVAMPRDGFDAFTESVSGWERPVVAMSRGYGFPQLNFWLLIQWADSCFNEF